jgi:hypothetical protein
MACTESSPPPAAGPPILSKAAAVAEVSVLVVIGLAAVVRENLLVIAAGAVMASLLAGLAAGFSRAGMLCVLVPMLGNALAAYVWLPLWYIAPGTAIRPIMQCGAALVVAVGTCLAGVPVGVHFIIWGSRRRGWLCIVFSLTPLFVSMLTANLLTALNNLEWAD